MRYVFITIIIGYCKKNFKQNLQTQKNLIGHPSFANLHYQTVLSEGSCLEGVEML